MNLLLDTHIILWWLSDDAQLSADHRDLLSDTGNLCLISSASIWEISIKQGLGKLKIPSNFLDVLKTQGFSELSVTWEHSKRVTDLPMHHRDPFDRMLIAQAQIEKLVLLSVDEQIKKYNVKVI
ncbi:MAG: type II toxin-antitoxin system VapC family toxin [Spirochaetales bacterium]|nr:type II toxin-antitoxin system VapC family toxin [Spirochaetales bacterium]